MTTTSTEHCDRNAVVRPLSDVLKYENHFVVRRFQARFALPDDQANAVFTETLRWLWYMASTEVTAINPEAHSIDAPMTVIDEMWHDFILVTRDYTDFCVDMFGRYIHHAPAHPVSALAPTKTIDDAKAALAALIGRKRAKYRSVFDVLGGDVFVRWYIDYPQRLSAGGLAALQRHTGRLPVAAEPGTADPVVDARDRDQLIEEALFANLILSFPEQSGTDAQETPIANRLNAAT